LRNGKLAGSINSYKEIQLTLIGTKLSDINMEIANKDLCIIDGSRRF